MRTDSPPLFPAVRRLCRLFRDALPRGCRLSAESWQGRHGGILLLLLALIVGVPLAAIDRGFSLTHGLIDAAPAAVLGIAACFARRDARSWSTTRDPLTKLANRTLLTERIDAVLSQHRSAAVLFIDLCGFKRVNDVLGYEAGDTILV